MVQPSGCAPMTHGWIKAKAEGFPDGWLTKVPCYDNPVTKSTNISYRQTGYISDYAKLVHDTQGEMVEFDEKYLIDIARLIAFETTVRIGPAAAIAVGGFFESLHNGIIKPGDEVLINIGEGTRRAPEFVEEMIYTTEHIDNINQCNRFNRKIYGHHFGKKSPDCTKYKDKNTV
jgi:threonine synthase